MDTGKLKGRVTGDNKTSPPGVAGLVSTPLARGDMTPSFIEKRKKPRVQAEKPTPAHPPKLADYEALVSKAELDELRFLAEGLRGRSVRIISGSVLESAATEMLDRLVPFLGELQVIINRCCLTETEEIRKTAKRLRQSLVTNSAVTKEVQDFYTSTRDEGLGGLPSNEDVVVLQDPEPLALVRTKKRTDQRWVWRCHLDLSMSNAESWKLLRPLVEAHDAAIFSTQSFSCRLSIPQYIFYPCIDPLSEKNKQLAPSFIQRVCDELGIDRSRPIVTQVSPFDRARDPLGVIEAYRIAKKYVDCQLVLAGSTSEDDPDSTDVLSAVKEAAEKDRDIILVNVEPESASEVNAIQSASTVIVQKSLYEGFGTAVTEALWKGKPVVGTAVGGIPNQIIHKFTGALVHSVEGCAYQIRYLLTHQGLAEQMGKNGREHVKENFLITSEVKRWLLLFHILLGVSRN